ncbi:restriction endonuclease subunit S [Candidatus Bipolaricaulota bacterium]|nr:restriction endonuclease subunit S [Candidatus Bipolaricaulota bacterium]
MRIRDFCDIRLGHSFRQRLTNASDGNVKVIQPKNISSEGFVSFGYGEPVRTDVSVSKPLQRDDILIVNRGRFSATVFDLPQSETWIVPSSILVLSLRAESVLSEYVACYLNSSNGQKLFRRHCERSTVPFISARNLANIDIPIPPLDRQKALIAFEKKAIKYARLSNRKQVLFRHILSHELASDEKSMRRRAQ